MSTENFKEQQHDRQEEGKELLREDEMRDLSQIPGKQLPGANQKSLLTKIGEGISNAAYAISDKVGITQPAPEGHEELDRDVRRQVKKVNEEIRKQAGDSNVEQHNDWEDSSLPKVKKEAENSTEKSADQSKGSQNTAEQKTSIAGKIRNAGESISHGITNLKDQITGGPVVEGHEELDRSVRRQVKKVNEEIRKQAGDSNIEQHNDWEDHATLPKFKKEAEKPDTHAKTSKPTDKTSIAGKVIGGVQGVSHSVAQGASSLTQTFSKNKEEKEEERNEDGTKHYKVVKDGIHENVSDLKHDQRVAQLGQEELTSKNPFQSLTSENNEESENRTLGEKVKGGLSDASQKISSTIGGVGQKVKSVFVHKEVNPQDKENAQQIA